jgi:nitrate/nitrite transport system substrate-binding protein
MTTGELWLNHPEKSLAMRADWVEKNPKAARAVTMAVMEAQAWCDANLAEMCQIIAGREYLKVPVDDIAERSLGTIDYGDGRKVERAPFGMKFWQDNASYPFQSHELWFLTENQRWGYQPMDLDTKALIKAVNREDIWRDAAKGLGLSGALVPASTSRGVEKFFDGKVFDPANPVAYLKSLAISRAAV